MSQELLAEESGLSLRTVQRIENSESAPRGDTLKRLALALDTSPDEMLDWTILEDKGYLTLMSLSALVPTSFLLFYYTIFWIFRRNNGVFWDHRRTGKSLKIIYSGNSPIHL